MRVLNTFNRGLSQFDAYPFVFSGTAIQLIIFVLEVIGSNRRETGGDVAIPTEKVSEKTGAVTGV